MTLKLLQPAEVTSARLKMGLLGFQSSGKTKTAALVSMGLVKHCQTLHLPYADKPIAFLDTETGSDWLIPDFKDQGIQLVVAKTRSFADLLTVTRDAEKECSVLIVDSVTHFWKELCESYCRKKEQERNKPAGSYRLQFQDWAYLKGRWGEFTDLFVNSDLHMILCGRAGYEYDYAEDDDGKKQLEKTGVKMKAEGEMGYEPSLLVQMEQCQKIEGKVVKEVWREAHVIKDRSTRIDGKTFVFHGQDDKGAPYPTAQLVKIAYSAFFPHISLLNLAGKQLGVDTTRTSDHTISAEKKDWSSTQRKVVLEEIQTLLLEFHPSTSVADKKAKVDLLRKHFHDEEIVWVKIEEMLPLVDLRMAYDSMYRELKGKPSQYGALFAGEAALAINDEIPGFDTPTAPVATSVRDQLLADIPNLKSMGDCMHFSIQLANLPGLSDEDMNVISKALMARQNEIGKQTKPGDEDDGNGGGGDADPPKNTPDDGKPGPDDDKPGQMPPPQQQPESPRPSANKKAKPAPAAAERTMADLVYAG